jgi:hypothetical protein
MYTWPLSEAVEAASEAGPRKLLLQHLLIAFERAWKPPNDICTVACGITRPQNLFSFFWGGGIFFLGGGDWEDFGIVLIF